MWIKGNPPALLVGMQIGAATAKNSMEGLENIKNETAFNRQFHFLIYLKKPIILI